MDKLLPVIPVILLAGCMSVPTEQAATKGQSTQAASTQKTSVSTTSRNPTVTLPDALTQIEADVGLTLDGAVDGYEKGIYRRPLDVFNAMANSASLDDQYRAQAMAYQLAIAAHMYDWRFVRRNIEAYSAFGPFAWNPTLDLGFDLFSARSWDCLEAEANERFGEAEQCWAGTGNIENAKRVIRKSTVADFKSNIQVEYFF